MARSHFFFVWGLLLSMGSVSASEKVVLIVHGGTGVERKELTPELEKAFRDGLTAALKAGYAVLKKNGTAMDAAESAVRVLEDDPTFNAGRGSVFTADGKNEMDASIMEGREKRAGAVGAVTIAKNPISLARAVMEKTPHVFLVSQGAEAFAKEIGAEIVDPKYFWTERRWKELQDEKAKAAKKGASYTGPRHHEWSTVGAVALDAKGDLVAATSTGGMTNKKFGRVGDTPVIGAGTYADNAAAGVSVTGHGEFFIRFAVAHEIVALMRHKKLSAAEATKAVIHGEFQKAGGEGGAIVLDSHGHAAFDYNSAALVRGSITESGTIMTALYER